MKKRGIRFEAVDSHAVFCSAQRSDRFLAAFDEYKTKKSQPG
jgi:hypothetical protein